MLRVFLSSTSEDLKPFRDAAADVITGQEYFVDRMEHFKAGPERTIEACQAHVRDADLVMLLVAFRRGWVPSPEEGGDGKKSIVAYELEAADRKNIPVLALLANATWPGNLWEEQDEGRAWIKDFRGRFNRLATFFDFETPSQDPPKSLPIFRSHVRDVLLSYRESQLKKLLPGVDQLAAPAEARKLRLVFPTPPDLPERPYPLLEPYGQPATFAGRKEDLADLTLVLKQRQSLVCLHAPSGAGKSSLLHAGLIPQLALDRVPAALDIHPEEPALATRLLAGIADFDSLPHSDEDWQHFVDCLLRARIAAGVPPVLVLDQFEIVFRAVERKERLAHLGPLLAGTFQRFPGVDGPLCRWILSYRQDFHGEVMTWLEDVLAEARAGGKDLDLPYDLRSPDRCQTWAMRVLGQPRPGGDLVASAARAFAAAIETPLALKNADGTPRFKWQIAPEDAARLAASFAEQRRVNSELPLTPQLQVVLARLLSEAKEETGWRIEVPAEPDVLIRDALDTHLRRALEEAFPITRDGRGRAERTKAVLVLRELCDASGRRAMDVPASTLEAALGQNSAEVIEKLTAPEVRLMVPQMRSDGTVWYSLPHDSLAELISQLFLQDQRLAENSLDKKLVDLWRLVTQRTEFFTRLKDPAALDLTSAQSRAIRQNRSTLLWDQPRLDWWKEASKVRARRDRRKALATLATLCVVAGLAFAGYQYSRQYHDDAEHQSIERIMSADNGQVLQALSDLASQHSYTPNQIIELLHRRTKKDAVTILIDGPRHFEPSKRLGMLLTVIGSVHGEFGRDPSAAGAMMAALDHYSWGDQSGLRNDALLLRKKIVEELRKRALSRRSNQTNGLWCGFQIA